MGYSVNIDWLEEFKNPDKWINHGRNALENACKHTDQCGDGEETNVRYSRYCEKCGVCEDSAEPMMNYAYPLHYLPDEDKILKVVQETNLTVMENDENGDCFLVLCGGGREKQIYLKRWLKVKMFKSGNTSKETEPRCYRWNMKRLFALSVARTDSCV